MPKRIPVAGDTFTPEVVTLSDEGEEDQEVGQNPTGQSSSEAPLSGSVASFVLGAEKLDDSLLTEDLDQFVNTSLSEVSAENSCTDSSDIMIEKEVAVEVLVNPKAAKFELEEIIALLSKKLGEEEFKKTRRKLQKKFLALPEDDQNSRVLGSKIQILAKRIDKAEKDIFVHILDVLKLFQDININFGVKQEVKAEPETNPSEGTEAVKSEFQIETPIERKSSDGNYSIKKLKLEENFDLEFESPNSKPSASREALKSPKIEGSEKREDASVQSTAKLEPNSASKKHIAKLEKALLQCHKAIRKLEETEVDFDADEEEVDSAYIKLSRYRQRCVKIYKKIAELKGNAKTLGRKQEKRLKFAGSRIPDINNKIDKTSTAARPSHRFSGR